MTILFTFLASIGMTVLIVTAVAWYRGLLPILKQYMDTLGDIVSGKEIIIHTISIEELYEFYDDEEDEEDDL